MVCKRLRRSAYPMMCKHADEAVEAIYLCDAIHDCTKCEYVRECITRFDALIDIG